MMSDDELRVLGEDICKNGLRDEITLLEGQLLDGRNRLEAMGDSRHKAYDRQRPARMGDRPHGHFHSLLTARTSKMSQNRDPIDAQFRGRRRLFRRKFAADYGAFDATWKAVDRSQIKDFMKKSGKGRRRVFDRIHAALTRHGGRLAALSAVGLKPRSAAPTSTLA